MTIIALPWSFKLLYGLLSDNVPISDRKRKPYLIIFGFVQFFALMFLFIAEPEEPIIISLILTIAALATAF